jgi:Rieske Fe-S protein
MNVERRTVLQIGGLVAVGGVVAACGSSASSTDSSAAAPAGSAGGGGSGTTKTSDVPVGGGVIIAAPAVVITQPSAGEFKAFTAICTHKGCTVSSVENNEILCPCHGSKFSGTDGSVIQGPATAPLAPAAITVSGDSIAVTG